MMIIIDQTLSISAVVSYVSHFGCLWQIKFIDVGSVLLFFILAKSIITLKPRWKNIN